MLPKTAENEKILEEIAEAIKKRGLKLTTSRQKVIEYLLQYGKHFEIEDLVLWIVERCKNRRNCPSRPTVYRTVKLLEGLGYVKPVLRQGNKTVYEFLPLKKEHYHLLCIRCGKLYEFEEPAIKEIVEKITHEQNFKYLNHHLEVYGICPNCLKEAEKEETTNG